MKNILIATDFSENSNRTLQYALEFAQKTDCNIFLFHDPQISIPVRTPTNIEMDLKKSYQEEYHTKLVNQFDNVLNVTQIKHDVNKLTYLVALEEGNTFQKINNAIDKYEIDLVFTGTRNISGLKRFFLGSTALELMQSANCPVFAVPQKGGYVKIEEVVFASDLADLDGEILQVINFVKFFDAELFILHVSEVNTENINLDSVVQNLKHKSNYDKIRLEIVHKSSDEAEKQIIDYLNKIKIIDLLVMFPERKGYFDRILGSGHTGNIISEISIPLLAFHNKIKA